MRTARTSFYLKLITADEAYHDTDGSFIKESGVHLVKPPNSKVSLPANVDGERPFNLLKKREGLEQVRVRSQHGIVARSTFTTMATLVLELAGTRRTKKAKQKQRKLPLAA